ncbi:MAG TPA: hypothetical protein VFP84_26200 [Kofleriaceae bacterium]|nr:hypothetical protein [Kofleriaceae bacterium]
MPTTTPTCLESIDVSALANVSGGCRHGGSSPTIINNNVAPAPAPQIAPPAPLPPAAPSVQTSVSINGQPA